MALLVITDNPQVTQRFESGLESFVCGENYTHPTLEDLKAEWIGNPDHAIVYQPDESGNLVKLPRPALVTDIVLVD